jgi:hypothetical protein
MTKRISIFKNQHVMRLRMNFLPWSGSRILGSDLLKKEGVEDILSRSY